LFSAYVGIYKLEILYIEASLSCFLIYKNKIWVNNGVLTKHVHPEYIPEGFSRGRLKLNKSPSRNDD